MKRSMHRPGRKAVVVLLAALAGPSARAADMFWDSNGASAGAGVNPNGTWGTNNFWTLSSAGTTATTNWTSGNTAVFAAGTDSAGAIYNVTLSSSQTSSGLRFEEGTVTLSGSSLNTGIGTIDVESAGGATINSTLISNSGLTKIGTGTLTLGGSNTYSGGTTVSAGTLAVATDSNLGLTSSGITLSGGTLQLTQGFTTVGSNRTLTLSGAGGTINAGFIDTFAGNINGTSGLIMKGGLLYLSGTNTYSGGTTLSGGLLGFTSASAVPASGAIDWVDGFLYFANQSLSLAPGGSLGSSITMASSSKTLQVDNTLTVQSGVTINQSAGTLNVGALQINAGATYNWTGGLLNLHNSSLTVGPGNALGSTVTLNNTALIVAGTLTIASGGTVNQGGGSLEVGTLQVSGGTYNWTSGQLAVHNSLTIGPGGPLGSSLSINNGMDLEPLGGANISGSVVVNGGTLGLGDGTSISGSVALNGGILNVGNAAITGILTLNGGSMGSGQLTNSGTIAGHTSGVLGTVINTGTINCVDGVAATLQISALTLNGGSVLDLSVGSASDSIDVFDGAEGGELTLAGGTVLNLSDAGGLTSGTYALITYGNLIGSLANLTLGSLPPGCTGTLSNDGDAIFVTLNFDSNSHAWVGGSGNWSDSSKWTGGAIPNSSALHVIIDGKSATTSSVALDQDATIGDLTLDSDDTLNINSTRTLTVAGTVGSALNGTVTNNGTIILSGSGGISGTGTLNNAASGTISGKGEIRLNISNAGLLQAKNGNLTLGAAGTTLTNTGTMQNLPGANLFVEATTVNNSGNIIVNAGGTIGFDVPLSNSSDKTLGLRGGLLSTPTLTNNSGGTVNGYGQITGNVVNNGSIDFYGPMIIEGNLTNNSGGTMVVRNAQTEVMGTTTNNGSITLQSDGDLISIATMAGPFNSAGPVTVTSGSFRLSGGGTESGSFTIASGATLEFAGGTHSFTAGAVWDGGGAVTLTAGQLNVAGGDERVGDLGTASFTQSVGTHVLGTGGTNQNLFLGFHGGSSGRYTLSGGSLTVNGFEYVGYGGDGTFIQSGGTHTAGSPGIYSELNVGHFPGTNSLYNLTAGSLIVNGNELIGVEGPGAFVQSGGTHTIGTAANNTQLLLGDQPGSGGSFSLGGGSLTVNGSEILGLNGPSGMLPGSAGTFIQTGGTHTVGSPTTHQDLFLGYSSGASGTYSLSSTGSLTVNGSEYVGNSGAGAFAQSGGTNTVTATLAVAASAGASGVYTLSAGALTTPTLQVNSGGTFNYNGGSPSITHVQLTGSGLMKLSPGGNKTLRVATISISGTSKLDLTDNKLIDTADSIGTWNGSSYTGVAGLIQSGRNGANWNGSGIITSQTQAAAGNFTTLGVARASDVRPATATATGTWAGQTITGTDTLIMYTYGGDATLDGKINVDDYIRIDSGIAAGLKGWSNGDFNYDGKVNIDDYTGFIDANIGTQGGVFFTAGGFAGGGSSLTAVPEPAGLALIAAACFAATSRRRRRAGN